MNSYATLIRSLVLSLIVIALALLLTQYIQRPASSPAVQQEEVTQPAEHQHSNHTMLKNGFQETVLNNQSPVVVTFFAEWCPSCSAMHPVIEEVAREMGNVQFVEVNVDEFADVANTYGIQAIPTFIFFNGGTMVDRVTGFMNKEQFVEAIKKQFGV